MEINLLKLFLVENVEKHGTNRTTFLQISIRTPNTVPITETEGYGTRHFTIARNGFQMKKISRSYLVICIHALSVNKVQDQPPSIAFRY
jgi:hypothetical protein